MRVHTIVLVIALSSLLVTADEDSDKKDSKDDDSKDEDSKDKDKDKDEDKNKKSEKDTDEEKPKTTTTTPASTTLSSTNFNSLGWWEKPKSHSESFASLGSAEDGFFNRGSSASDPSNSGKSGFHASGTPGSALQIWQWLILMCCCCSCCCAAAFAINSSLQPKRSARTKKAKKKTRAVASPVPEAPEDVVVHEPLLAIPPMAPLVSATYAGAPASLAYASSANGNGYHPTNGSYTSSVNGNSFLPTNGGYVSSANRNGGSYTGYTALAPTSYTPSTGSGASFSSFSNGNGVSYKGYTSLAPTSGYTYAPAGAVL